MSRSVRALLALVFVLALPATAFAAFSWNDPGEDVSGSGTYGPEGGAVAPDGTALLFGFANGGVTKIAVRPPGGPIGTPEAIGDLSTGGNFGTNLPLVAFDSAGNALIGSPMYGQIAYRPVGGPVKNSQALGAYGAPRAISMAPSGAALVGFDQASDHTVRIASRAPGPDTLVDTAGAQVFTIPGGATSLLVVGLQLDPDGAAVAVMKDNNGVLYQSTRGVLGSFSNPPTVIPNAAGLTAVQSNPTFASSGAGHAVLAFISGTNADALSTPVAAYRAPGGAFGTPVALGAKPGYLAVSAILPAVDEDGDGLVAWTHEITASPGGCADGATFGIWAAPLHGGSFTAGAQLTTALSDRSQALRIAGAGHRVALEYRDFPPGADACDSGDDASTMFARTFVSQASGLVQDDDHALASGTDGHLPQYELQGLNLALGAGGTELVTTDNATGSAQAVSLHVREGADATPTAEPTPTTTPIPTATATVVPTATPTASPTPTPTRTDQAALNKALATFTPAKLKVSEKGKFTVLVLGLAKGTKLTVSMPGATAHKLTLTLSKKTLKKVRKAKKKGFKVTLTITARTPKGATAKIKRRVKLVA